MPSVTSQFDSAHFLLQAAESFYDDASQYDEQLTFDNMNLSRPILKVTDL